MQRGGNLASSFRADLQELFESDDEAKPELKEEESAETALKTEFPANNLIATSDRDGNFNRGRISRQKAAEVADSGSLGISYEVLNSDEIRETLNFVEAELAKYEINEKLKEFTEENTSDVEIKLEEIERQPVVGLSSDVELKKLETLCIQLDREVINVFNEVKVSYSKRFPELSTIITNPLSYVAVVSTLGNATEDISSYDLTDLLPNSSIIALILGLSVTTGSLLSESEIEFCLKKCEEAQTISANRNKILLYLEKQMETLAPNLTSLMGSFLAVRLMLHAGGLEALALMPSQNIMLLGSDVDKAAKFSSGFAMKASGGGKGYGVLFSSELVQTTQPAKRIRAIRLLSGKCSLAARCDFQRVKRGLLADGEADSVGRQLRQLVVNSIIKAQTPPAAPLKKSLPVPEEQPRKKRGGKRHRRQKEKYGQTELQKKRNRLGFGLEAQGDYDHQESEDEL